MRLFLRLLAAPSAALMTCAPARAESEAGSADVPYEMIAAHQAVLVGKHVHGCATTVDTSTDPFTDEVSINAVSVVERGLETLLLEDGDWPSDLGVGDCFTFRISWANNPFPRYAQLKGSVVATGPWTAVPFEPTMAASGGKALDVEDYFDSGEVLPPTPRTIAGEVVEFGPSAHDSVYVRVSDRLGRQVTAYMEMRSATDGSRAALKALRIGDRVEMEGSFLSQMGSSALFDMAGIRIAD